MTTMTESATKAIREHAAPALEALEENVRDVRRAVVAGRYAVEDCAAETTLQASGIDGAHVLRPGEAHPAQAGFVT